MYLIFDTETTGFPSKDLPKTHPAQARIIQLAWIVLDEQLKEVAAFKCLIRSNNLWKISSGAQQAHGISQQECDKYGLNIDFVLPLFIDAHHSAKRVIAHNLRFDSQLVDIEAGAQIGWQEPKHICTMQLMTPICKLPSMRMTYKWPKLQEAYQYCFKEEFKGAHDALNDVRATARIFKWLVDNHHVML